MGHCLSMSKKNFYEGSKNAAITLKTFDQNLIVDKEHMTLWGQQNMT